MENKHYILRTHLYRLKDHINDGWQDYEDGKKFKQMNEPNEAKDSFDCARQRAEMAQREVKKIEDIDINLEEDDLYFLYEDVLDRLDMLKDKVSKE